MRIINKNWIKNILKVKIFLVLGFSFCITLGMLFSLVDLYINIYDPQWNGIFSNDEVKNNEKIIFLIGASNVYPINVDDISKKINSDDIDYGIFNLADMSDTPTKRMNSVDNLLGLKPDIIIYGLSITDFELDRDYESEFFNYDFSYYLLNPNEFFRYFFSYVTNSDLSERFPASPKDRMIQSIKYILRGSDYTSHPFINFNKNDIVSQDEIYNLYEKDMSFRGIDTDSNNQEIIAVNNIIETFQSNGTKVLIFTPPYNELFFEYTTTKDIENFEKIIENLAKKYDVETLYLHDRLMKENIWKDPYHVAINENSKIYTDKIEDWLVEEFNK